MRTTRPAAAVLAVVTLAVAGCSAAHHPGRGVPLGLPEPTPQPMHHPAPVHQVQARLMPHLEAFSDCGQLLQTLRQQSLRRVSADGLPWNQGPVAMLGAPPPAPTDVTAAGGASGQVESGSAAAGTGAAAAAPGTTDFSGTNNQEVGVDEPDIVKTDGHLMVLVQQQTQALEVLDVSGSSPRKLSDFSLQGLVEQPQLFLVGSSAVAIGQEWSHNSDAFQQPRTVAVVIDLSQPARPRVVRTFRVSGEQVDARYVGGRVELVVQSAPALPMLVPSSKDYVEQALRHNRNVIQQAPLRAWLPTVSTTPSHRSRTTSCTDTWHTVGAADDALTTVSVVSFDPADEASVHETTVFGSATIVYASTRALYLATPGDMGPVAVPMVAPMPVDGPPGAMAGPASGGGMVASAPVGGPGVPGTTRIHEFDISDPASPRYVGSGVVRGTLVDQYSLGEYDGYLRVATTVGQADPAPGEGLVPTVKSDNRVTILHAADGALVTVGQVRGLGRGEKIYGVRFLGTLGYVVTFRQIDPLYILDLADPRHPRALGHLKVTGYSAYLHPLGNGLMLGLGREVDGRAHPVGEQLSVFNVSDPAAPSLVSRLRMPDAFSPAEQDHHAFLWWPQDRLIVVPMASYDGATPYADVVYHVDANGDLHRMGALHQPDTSQEFFDGSLRSVVIGGLLYTVTARGVMANDLHSLARVAWLSFQ